MNIRTGLAVIVAVATVVSNRVASAATTTITSVSQLSEATVVGNDTLEYAGSGKESYAGILTSSPGDKRASTIKVTNPNTELTLAHLARTNGGFVKTGLGSLILQDAGLTFSGGTDSGFWGEMKPLMWTDGSADEHYSPLVVHQGTLVLDFADKTQTLNAADSVVGHLSSTSPDPSARLEVRSGILDVGNSIAIDRGAGRANNNPQHSVYVGTNGVVKGWNLWMTFSGMASGYVGNSLLDIDGGRAEFDRAVQVGRSSGASHILVRNGGLFSAANSYAAKGLNFTAKNDVMNIPHDQSATATVFEVTGVSTGRFHFVTTLRVGEKAVVKVSDGGTLLNDAYCWDSLTNRVGGGVTDFDDALVRTWYDRGSGEWFPYNQAYTVRAGGVNFFTDTIASFGGASRGDGTVTLSGAGAVSLHPGEADVDVKGGGLRMTASPTETLVAEEDKTGSIVSDAANVVVSGDGALGNMTLVAGTQRNVFTAEGLENGAIKPGANAEWAFAGIAAPRADGWLRIGASYVSGAGNVWKRQKIDVSKSFVLSYDCFVVRHSFAAGSYPPYGSSVIFQNTPEGVAKSGSGGRALGFADASAKWPNSFALGCDFADSSMRYSRLDGSNAYFLTGDGTGDARVPLGLGSAVEPHRVRVAYDVVSQTVVYSVSNFLGTAGVSISQPGIDLATICGASSAYLGFGGTNNGGAGSGEHLVGNIQLVYADESPRATVRTGGRAQVGTGKTFLARLDRESRAKTWIMDELDAADGATVSIDGASDASLGFVNVKGAGTVVKSGAGKLGFCSAINRFAGNVTVQEGGLRFSEEDSYASKLAMDASNWGLSASNAAFEEGGIGIGRAGNAQPIAIGNANSMCRVPVNCAWTISYDLKISIVDVGGAYGFYAIYFHNDPRGSATVGEEGAQNAYWHCVNGIEKCAAVVWGGGNGQGSGLKNNQVAKYENGTDSGWTPTAPVKMGLSFSGNTTASTNGTVTLSYDPAEKVLKVRMTQIAAGDVTNVFETVLADFDIPAAVGDDCAYIGFGANTAQNWFGIRQTVTNFRYASGVESTPYVGGVLSIECPNTQFALDAGEEGGTLKLAGTLSAVSEANIRLTGGNPTVAATAGSVVCDGMLTIDGGIFEIGEHTLDGVKKLNLVNGAKLKIPTGTTVCLLRLYVNGQRVADGSYTSDFVVGGGELRVSRKGFALIVK